MTGRSVRAAAGRAAVFLEVILRDAPCRFGFRTGFCFAPRGGRDVGPRGGRRRAPPAATGGGLFAVTLLQTTRFLSHCFRVELTLPDPVSRLSSRKNKLPTGSAFGFWLIVSLIYHISRENQCLGAMQMGKGALFGRLFCRNR